MEYFADFHQILLRSNGCCFDRLKIIFVLFFFSLLFQIDNRAHYGCLFRYRYLSGYNQSILLLRTVNGTYFYERIENGIVHNRIFQRSLYMYFVH